MTYMLKKKYSFDEIMAEFDLIVDSHESTLFELSARDINSITDVYYDDEKFNAAWKTVLLKTGHEIVKLK